MAATAAGAARPPALRRQPRAHGGPVGDDEALTTFHGADAGDPVAIFNLAAKLKSSGDLVDAIRWYRRADELGDNDQPRASRRACALAETREGLTRY